MLLSLDRRALVTDPEPVRRSAPVIGTTILVVAALCVAGCGSGTARPKASATGAADLALRKCFRARGYAISPESAQARGTAPRRFEFVTVWNLVKPVSISFALTISKTTRAAEAAAVWVRGENAKLGRGAVLAPVVRFGKVDVLWTAEPRPQDARTVYGCLRPSA
jgi:hypothetical protein